MEYFYNIKKRRFEPCFQKSSAKLYDDCEKLKDNHLRATDFVKTKNRYLGTELKDSKYIYFNIEDFGFILNVNGFVYMVFYYEYENVRSMTMVPRSCIINYRKWKPYFAQNENPEVAKYYIKNRKLDGVPATNIECMSKNVQLWLAVNGGLDD